MIGLMIVGNPFPVVEHPFITDKEGKVVMEKPEKKDSNGKDIYKRKVNEKGYFGKPINPGYDSHITLGKTFLLLWFIPFQKQQFGPFFFF